MQHEDHEHMQHGEGDMQHDSFMSMVMMTKDLPRSRDGLPMEDYEARFGPDHPAVAPGTVLYLTLDGDTVRSARYDIEKTASEHKKAPATQARQDAEWLVRFMDALGHPWLLRAASELHLTDDKKRANKLLSAIKRSVKRNPLIRWRLNGLAEYAGYDAYGRLMSELDSIGKKTSGKKDHTKVVAASVVADQLKGLELAQALVAAASFRVAKGKGEQS